MAVLGRIVKKTTELGSKRRSNKVPTFNDQIKTLSKLLKFAQYTEFGTHYDFDSILQNDDFIKEYQRIVPITDYDSIYKRWLHRAIDGEAHVLWPGKVKYFALSSGTTGSPSKRIPVTRQMIRSFQMNTIKQFAATSLFDLSDAFYQKSFLVVGGSSKLEKYGNRVEGDLSGILKKHTSVVLQPLTKPDPTTAAIKDWSKKLERMVEKAPEWDISTIAGSPTWCVMLMEKIIRKHGVQTIHDIWPNLELYVFGGVYIEPYLDRFEKVCGKKVALLNTYLASEGYIAFQTKPDKVGMQLLTKSGIFFEFVPFNTTNFDSSGNIKSDAKALTLKEVELGTDYALVISTNAGLWRYLIGDLVRFTDLEHAEIIISGRIKQYVSLTGEHLSLDNMNQAIQKTTKELGITIPEFCLYADKEELRHHWYFGLENESDKERVVETVDKFLCELNDDYHSCRKYDTLKQPQAHFVPVKMFYKFMKEKGKFGSQQKFPRVMNDHQAKSWRLYIKTK
jgi:phenylacetate-coenzyme A ligase PaaK-like adenylate-forming protein